MATGRGAGTTGRGLARGLLVGAGVVGLGVTGLLLHDVLRGLPEEAQAPEAGAPAEVPAEVAAAEAAAEAPEAVAEATAPAGALPRFDLVRVDPQTGLVTVAGMAAPDAEVTVLVDDLTAAETRADAAGAFAVLFVLGDSAVPRAVTLEMRVPGAETGPETGPETGAVTGPETGAGTVVASEQSLLIAPTAQALAEAAEQDRIGEGLAEVVAADDVAGAAIAEAVAEGSAAPGEPAAGEAVAAAAEAVTAEAVEAPAAAGEAVTGEPAAPALAEAPTGPEGVVAAEELPEAAGTEPAGAEAEVASEEAAAEVVAEAAQEPVAEMAEAVTAAEAVPEVPAAPVAEAPELATAAPAAEAPATDGPATAVPATDGPATEAPAAMAEPVAEAADAAALPEVAARPEAQALPAVPAELPARAGTDVAEEAASEPAGSAPVAPPAEPELVAAAPELAEPLPEVGAPSGAASGVASGAASGAPAARPAAVLVDSGGVRVVQPAGATDGGAGARPEVMENVVIDAISYAADGAVQLAGRATGDGAVRLYVDNRLLETIAVGAGGGWSGALPEIDTGVYTLRVDELDASGAVVSRFETPFRREDPAVLAALAEVPARGARAQVVTVQPGATLWGISRDRYGEGMLYVQVFEANRELIRNPDLIYPGQVFALPEIAGTAPRE